MVPDEKIQALKDAAASFEKEANAAANEDWYADQIGKRDEALRDIAILEKFQNADRDLLPDMERLLRAAVKADQAAYETAQAKLTESAGELAQLERFKQLLNG